MTEEMYEDLLERNRLQISELNTLTEEQDKHIVELEKENARLKEINSHTLSQLNLDNGELIIENEKLKKENARLIALINAERKRQEECDDVHLRKIADLEKENAELKHTIAELRRDKDNLNTHSKAQEKLSEYRSDQLTKAKNLLQKVADVCGYPNYDIPVELYSEIADFLKDSEVEK